MTVSISPRRLAGVALAAFVTILPAELAAQAPTLQELMRISASGSYLAARHAAVKRDSSAASAYYRAALRADPRNTELLERAFLAALAEGEVEEAVKLAERILQGNKTSHIARLVVGVRGLKQKQYAPARQNIAQSSVRGQITDLAATLLSAWALQAAGDTKGAVESIDKLAGPDGTRSSRICMPA